MGFEPSSQTNAPDIRVAKSIVDYVFRWMGKRFLDVDQQEEIGILSPEVRARLAAGYANGGTVEPAAAPAAPVEAAPPARPRCSSRGTTRSSAPAARVGWCERAAATPVASAGQTLAAASSCG
jgi:ribonucleoside-diphosphate reductase alpha chain